ncbi:MAG TPA: M28 family metallopeptidase [Terracidiphilus sp.]|nr:M28 family metallopeptidase [Terracidiphilus sp.]
MMKFTGSLAAIPAVHVLSYLVLSSPFIAFAQQGPHPAARLDFEVAGAPLKADPADPQIAAALKQISAERVQANITRLVEFNNRSTLGSNETDLKPGTGVLAAADWIKSQFESYSKECGGCLEVSFDESIEQPGQGFNGGPPRIVKPTLLRNVVAIMKGSDPVASKRIYLVTGHYDTRETDVMNTHDPAPGANDDATGTAVSLEAAHVLSKLKFPATIVFVTVAGEEQGLNGSRHLAQRARKEGWQLEGVLNNDIVGGDTTPGDGLQSKQRIRVFSEGIPAAATPEQVRQIVNLGAENETPSRQLAREVLAAGRTYLNGTLTPVMELRLDRFLRGGDHRSFSEEGFAAVRLTEWRENFDHQHQHVRVENGKEYGDLLKFDDFNYIARVARLNSATLATLASSPGVPQRVRVLTSNLDNDTILKWDAPTSPTPAVKYQIVWRETAANDWQYGVDAGKYAGSEPNSARLPVSKDNVFFGLRACTTAGICSPAVAPVPSRE